MYIEKYVLKQKKTVRIIPDGLSFIQRYRDSNPNIQSQSLLCYLYTIPLSVLRFVDPFCVRLLSTDSIISHTLSFVNPFFEKS